jgi:hypothetical protein
MEELDYTMVPGHLCGGLRRYVEEHIMPGGFLRSCLENNLMQAVSRADATSRASLRGITLFMYNELPSNCWGSSQIVQEWVDNVRP